MILVTYFYKVSPELYSDIPRRAGNKIPLRPRLWSPLQDGGPRTEPAPVHGSTHPEGNRVAPDCMIMDSLE